MISTPLACHIDRVVVTVGVKPRHGIGWNIHEALTIDTAAAFLVSTSDLAAKGLPLGLGLGLRLRLGCHRATSLLSLAHFSGIQGVMVA